MRRGKSPSWPFIAACGLTIALLSTQPAVAQQCDNGATLDLPGICPEALNLVLHDAGHTATAVTVAYGLELLPGVELSETQRFLLATVALPILQETWDYLKYQRPAGEGPNLDTLHDPLTYQGAWVPHLVKKKKYWQAAVVAVAWGSFIYWWNVERT